MVELGLLSGDVDELIAERGTTGATTCTTPATGSASTCTTSAPTRVGGKPRVARAGHGVHGRARALRRGRRRAAHPRELRGIGVRIEDDVRDHRRRLRDPHRRDPEASSRRRGLDARLTPGLRAAGRDARHRVPAEGEARLQAARRVREAGELEQAQGRRATAGSARRAPSASGRRWRRSTSPGSRPGRRCSTGSRPSRSGSSAAKTNVSYNCLDRHLEGPNAWRRNKAAIIWEGEPGDTRTLTYGELHREVCKFANVLLGLGVAKGDRVALYMPMIPELAIAHARLHAHRRAALDRVRRLLGRGAARPHQRRGRQGGGHGRRRLPARRALRAQGRGGRGAARARPASSTWWWCSARARPVEMQPGRDHWWHDADGEAPRPTARPRSSTPSTRSSSSTRAARPGSRRASCTRRAATSCTWRRPRRRSST